MLPARLGNPGGDVVVEQLNPRRVIEEYCRLLFAP